MVKRETLREEEGKQNEMWTHFYFWQLLHVADVNKDIKWTFIFKNSCNRMHSNINLCLHQQRKQHTTFTVMKNYTARTAVHCFLLQSIMRLQGNMV